MKAYSEATPSGGGKKYGVELDETDMTTVDGWTNLPLVEKHRAMSDRADILLIDLMRRRGDISSEFAAQRIREIQTGTNS